jgi:hypothetical protein
LIRPVETSLANRLGRPYPFGQPASIPSIACVGRFESSEPARPPGGDFSALVVIWFQNEFALPIDDAVRMQLQAIDWQQHAIDGIY